MPFSLLADDNHVQQANNIDKRKSRVIHKKERFARHN